MTTALRLSVGHPVFRHLDTVQVGRTSHAIPPGCEIRAARHTSAPLLYVRDLTGEVHALNEVGEVPIPDLLLPFVTKAYYPGT